jgi:hypothetical protein
VFGASVAVEVKALACELPATTGVPLSRWRSAELARELVLRGVVAFISAATVWRVLRKDAIHRWFHRSWIFPRDPGFAFKAARVLEVLRGPGTGRQGIRRLRRRKGAEGHQNPDQGSELALTAATGQHRVVAFSVVYVGLCRVLALVVSCQRPGVEWEE